ncbi:hypothetical protein XELAEV_18023494mg [Xenopus laevis]|uniref:Uncharacterized protein n=1 Tax=Xenopus laevis TaxID=8355 RepID=A0A974D496_XENLA|nr:hypothetical protein XELAEV_18023494mg [Xenopus laevis]
MLSDIEAFVIIHPHVCEIYFHGHGSEELTSGSADTLADCDRLIIYDILPYYFVCGQPSMNCIATVNDVEFRVEELQLLSRVLSH